MSDTRHGVLVLDATLLNHSARADYIDLLGSYLQDFECWTTTTVISELRAGLHRFPSLQRAIAADWLRVDALDTIEGLMAYGRWGERVGASDNRHRGEASVFACAELRHGTAVTDDRTAARTARAYGVEAHGTLWLLARLVREDVMTLAAAGSYVEALRAEGARLPCRGSGFARWCSMQGIPLQQS
ncbi:hypothetical protein ACG5V6_06580 [Streptomyces chitinivorans]|uniref:PIN domain-containing protein n=1 Tax=Streptomyces chitinivorans TaxID=1257027 RepID=A0ABW7HPT6_9ACTN|nr:hypothetical protein [Streptomyces chitinivorans]MDH2410645.1 hypothetical protein [Streptomyces chitinivorans]